MNNYDELLKEILQQCEVGTKPFNELFSALQELTGDNLVENLNHYFEDRIKSIMNNLLIDESENISESWYLLESIQVAICKFLYKKDLKLSSVLYDFVYDFDRIDDPQMRAYILDRLKRHKLSYA